jgi:hypothetical protein
MRLQKLVNILFVDWLERRRRHRRLARHTRLASRRIEMLEERRLLAFSIADVTVIEDVGTFAATVSLSSANTEDVSVNVATVGGTAVAGSDYVETSQVVTIPAGQTSVDVNITILADTKPENEQVFSLALSNPIGTTIDVSRAWITIIDDDASISGTKWDDIDGNGKFDPGESLVAGVTIYLDMNNNFKLDDGERTDVTDADGAYAFTSLLPDKYFVREVVPSGFEQTYPRPTPSISKILATLDASIAGNPSTVTSKIPNRFDFTEGVTGNMILDGSNDMFDSGNFLNTNLAKAIDYTGGVVTDGDGLFGAGSSYFTRKYDGLFVMSAQNIDITEFEITGNNGADRAGTASGSVIQIDNTYTAFVKQVSGTSDPSINHVILVPGDGSPQSQSFSTNTDSDQHLVTGLDGVDEIHYLLFASADGGVIEDSAIQLIASTFIGSAGLTTDAHYLPLSSGAVFSGHNFGNREIVPGSISGMKWSDLDQDGRRDGSEPGVAGWTIFLDTNRNGTLDADESSTLTNTNGHYAFTGLPYGDYRVAEVQQEGWEQTFPSGGGRNVTVGNGELVDGINFGNHELQLASISGTKWDDVNGNGARDRDESLVAGVTIYLDANNNRQFDDGELSEVTDAEGAYAFTGLVPDDYVVREVELGGFEQTFPTYGVPISEVLDRLDANFAEVTSRVPNRFDFSGGVTGNWIVDGGSDMFDYGNRLKTNLATYIDYTAGMIVSDSQFGVGSSYFTQKHPGLFAMSAKNIDIREFEIGGGAADGAGKADGTIIPLTNGFTAFVKRVYGSFQPSINHIILVPGDGSAQSQDFSSNTSSDYHRVSGLADVDQIHYLLVASSNGGFITDNEIQAIGEAFVEATGIYTGAYYVPLGSGELVTDRDFGNREIIRNEINGTKWNDLDQDGERDADEPGLAGWTIFLDANGNGDLDAGETSTLTNADGNYSFTGLTTGNYLVAEVQQIGWQKTFPSISAWA